MIHNGLWVLIATAAFFSAVAAAQAQDKLAVYQTLYTVLTTLVKLFAPVVPFLAEEMYQNLRTDSDPESVNLCDYPAEDESLIDAQLSADVEALSRSFWNAL